MRKSAWIALGALVVAQTGLAQIQLDRAVLVAIPPEDAVVLDPAELWGRTDPNPFTHIAGLDQPKGHARIVLREGDKPSWWQHTLHIPFDPERYPIATVTYRATGILPSARPVLSLGTGEGECVDVALNQDLVPDGELHQLLVDLRELGARGAFNSLQITPHCRGPEPAVFELLGLRFESDHDLPLLAKRDEPEFSLQVVDAKGQGVPGATVTVDVERLNFSRTATTDAAGKVTLRAANNPRDEHTLRVAKEGRATVDLEPDKKGGFQPIVVLLRGTRHGGTVRDEKGQPIANAQVQIGAYTKPPQIGDYTWRVTSQTDPAGRWRTAPLPAEGVHLSVHLWHPDYLPESVRPPPVGKMRQGTAVLIMSRGMALHGAVLNPEGEPVAGAAVTQGHGRHFEGHASVKIDPDGRFAFTRRQLGKVVLTVEAGGFAPTVIALDVVPGYLPGVSPQFLPTEGSRTFDFRLQEAAEISGTIRLPDGGPAEGAEVYLVPQEGYLQLGRLGEGGHTPCQSLETRADGGYRFSAVKGNWLLVARHRLGYTETTPALYEGSHDLHLEKWTRIEGTYHIGTKPVGGCQISVSRSLRWYVPGKPLRFPYIFHELRGNTDEQGRFTIDMVPPGKGTVGPRLRTGSNWPMSHGERYTLLAGGTARVTIGGTGLPLIGKLALPAGAAVKAAWQLSGPVVKTTLKKAVRRAMTARKVRLTFVGVMQADGSFRINDVPAGDYALAVALCGPAVLGGMGKAIGSLEHRFTVPPMPGGRSDEPLGLGILTVVLD